MPHMSIEYSANLDRSVDMTEFCAVVQRAILDTGLFELGAVRVRALRADAYAIADRLPENAFIHMCFRIGAGRSEADKRNAGEAVFAAALADFAGFFAWAGFAGFAGAFLAVALAAGFLAVLVAVLAILFLPRGFSAFQYGFLGERSGDSVARDRSTSAWMASARCASAML